MELPLQGAASTQSCRRGGLVGGGACWSAHLLASAPAAAGHGLGPAGLPWHERRADLLALQQNQASVCCKARV